MVTLRLDVLQVGFGALLHTPLWYRFSELLQLLISYLLSKVHWIRIGSISLERCLPFDMRDILDVEILTYTCLFEISISLRNMLIWASRQREHLFHSKNVSYIDNELYNFIAIRKRSLTSNSCTHNVTGEWNESCLYFWPAIFHHTIYKSPPVNPAIFSVGCLTSWQVTAIRHNLR